MFGNVATRSTMVWDLYISLQTDVLNLYLTIFFPSFSISYLNRAFHLRSSNLCWFIIIIIILTSPFFPPPPPHDALSFRDQSSRAFSREYILYIILTSIFVHNVAFDAGEFMPAKFHLDTLKLIRSYIYFLYIHPIKKRITELNAELNELFTHLFAWNFF